MQSCVFVGLCGFNCEEEYSSCMDWCGVYRTTRGELPLLFAFHEQSCPIASISSYKYIAKNSTCNLSSIYMSRMQASIGSSDNGVHTRAESRPFAILRLIGDKVFVRTSAAALNLGENRSPRPRKPYIDTVGHCSSPVLIGTVCIEPWV